MPTIFDGYAFKATGGTATRSDPDRWTDTLNVLEFGAKGDGVTDDTNAIQSAINAACPFGKQLIFPPPSPCYIISNKLTIPRGCSAAFLATTTSPVSQVSQLWALVGLGGRATIQQQTDGLPIFYLQGTTAGDQFVSWRIENFRFQWKNNQAAVPGANTYHVNAIEFDSTSAVHTFFVDYIIRNVETVNGCRGIGINIGVQAGTRGSVACWGGLIEKVWHDSGCSGSAIFLGNKQDDRQPNNLIRHVYHNRGASVNEESLFATTCDCLAIDNYQINGGTGPWMYFGGSGMVTVRNLAIENSTFNNVVSVSTNQNALVNMHFSDVHFQRVFLSANTINVPAAGTQILFSADGPTTVVIDAIQELFMVETSGSVVYWNNVDTARCQFRQVNDIADANITIAATNALPNVTFASQRTMTFFKNALTTSMNAVVNDSPRNVKGEIVDTGRWIAGIEVFLDAAVTAGTVQVTLFKNGVILDAGAVNVVMVSGSGTFGSLFVVKCKVTGSPAYKLVPGDVLDVRITTASNMTGPANLVANVIIADMN